MDSAPPDLLAEDLAAFALDLAQLRTAAEVLATTADAVVGLVPGASDAVVSVLRRGEVELDAATGRAAEGCEAWQLALGSGPAADASTVPGRAVLTDDLTIDPRWVPVHAVAAQEGLPSVLSVAAALPATNRTLVLSWYAPEARAFASADCARVALLVAAHASLAIDRALHADHLRTAMVSRQEIGQAVGLLAAERSVGLADAFVLLRQESQRRNERLADLARRILQEHG
jgi:GAF domain-containing protein